MNTAEDFIILQGHVYQHNKKNDNRTLQTRELKKFSLFSEHTSYIFGHSQKIIGVGLGSDASSTV